MITKQNPLKIRNLVELYTVLPEDERVIVDVLRKMVIEYLPQYCKEKISYNVPFFYGNKGLCIIWPSTVPRGGIKKVASHHCLADEWQIKIWPAEKAATGDH